MSPVAFKILSAAYENYLKSGDRQFACQLSGSDLADVIPGIRQLATDGYIDEVSDQLFDLPIRLDPTRPIVFHITEVGLEYIRQKREADL